MKTIKQKNNQKMKENKSKNEIWKIKKRIKKARK